MSRLLVCGETLVGLATAATTIPGVSSQVHLDQWLLAGALGLLPAAYSVAVGIFHRVYNPATQFGFDDQGELIG